MGGVFVKIWFGFSRGSEWYKYFHLMWFWECLYVCLCLCLCILLQQFIQDVFNKLAHVIILASSLLLYEFLLLSGVYNKLHPQVPLKIPSPPNSLKFHLKIQLLTSISPGQIFGTQLFTSKCMDCFPCTMCKYCRIMCVFTSEGVRLLVFKLVSVYF